MIAKANCHINRAVNLFTQCFSSLLQMYETRVTSQNRNQVVVSIIFRYVIHERIDVIESYNIFLISVVCLLVEFKFVLVWSHRYSLISFYSNLTDRHIKSMEFNVLDSLNTKLIRPVSRISLVLKLNVEFPYTLYYVSIQSYLCFQLKFSDLVTSASYVPDA